MGYAVWNYSEATEFFRRPFFFILSHDRSTRSTLDDETIREEGNGKERKVCHRTTSSSSSRLLMVLPVRISAAKSSSVKFQEPANLLPRDEKRKDNETEAGE